MSVTKHAPGSWKASGHWVELEGSEYAICLCRPFGRTDEETRANARLISAAPEMLEALQSIAGYLDDTAACNSDKAMVSRARAAITKATGVDFRKED